MQTDNAKLWPGLDHIANFINTLDTEGMTAKDVRTAIYAECLLPHQHARSDNAKLADEIEKCLRYDMRETLFDLVGDNLPTILAALRAQAGVVAITEEQSKSLHNALIASADSFEPPIAIRGDDHGQ